MKAEAHLVVSCLLALFFFFWTGSLGGAALCIVAGFLIDTDHLVDYLVYKRRLTFSLKEFFSNYYVNAPYTIVPFHGIEYLWVLYFLQILTGSNLLLGMAIGMTAHMLMDIFGNKGLHPLGYFISFRLMNGFRSKKLNTYYKG